MLQMKSTFGLAALLLCQVQGVVLETKHRRKGRLECPPGPDPCTCNCAEKPHALSNLMTQMLPGGPPPPPKWPQLPEAPPAFPPPPPAAPRAPPLPPPPPPGALADLPEMPDVNPEEYAHCQSRCELKSCGSSCQEAHKSFDECSARCYPQSPSGKEAMFVPPSVRAASMAFVRISDCKKMRRVYDDRHFKCLHICGPKIAACMQSTCPNAVPESELQKSCMESCEKTSCGDSCYRTFDEAKVCYQESCEPGDASVCSQKCHQQHDDSCMSKCGSNLGSCIASRCTSLLNEDAGYNECEQTCVNTHCGNECVQRSRSFLSCNEKCNEAITV